MEGVYGGGAEIFGGGCSVCALCCMQTYSGALSRIPTIDGILYCKGRWKGSRAES